MRDYPVRDEARPWDLVLTMDRINKGISAVPVSAIAAEATASADWDDITGKPSDFPPSAHVHAIADTTGLQAAIDGKQNILVSTTNIKTINGSSILGAGDLVVSGGGGVSDGDKGDITVSSGGITWVVDAGAITLAKMADIATGSIVGRSTAGTGVPEVLTAANVRAIINVADGSTANASDASLRDRATHTGTQTASTISDFSASVTANAAVAANTAKVTNATHTGEVTGGTALTITADAVTNTKLANMATATIKGRVTAAAGDPEDLTAAQVRTLLNVADGATANSSDASLRDRTTHTGTQGQATITSLVTDLAAKAPLASPTFTGTVTLPAGQVVNGVTLTTAGGTSDFLRADGTYAAPAGGGGSGLTAPQVRAQNLLGF